MHEVTVYLCDAITPKTCATLLIHLIKYILYQSEQIPMNYDCLASFLKRCPMNTDNAFSCNSSYASMKAQHFYKSIDLFLSTCEKTFHNLERLLSESLGVKELVVIVGATVLSAKKIIRIAIPNMSFNGCEKEHSARRNLQSLCRHIITSDALHEYFVERVRPTNIYFFLKVDSSCRPNTELFYPKDSFRLSKIGKQMKISLEQPKENICPCLESISETNYIHQKNNVIEIEESWYQCRDFIQGLKDKGNHSLFNAIAKN